MKHPKTSPWISIKARLRLQPQLRMFVYISPFALQRMWTRDENESEPQKYKAPPPLFFWSLFLSACVKIGFNVFRLSLFSYLLVEVFISRLLLFLSHVRTGDSVWWSAWPLQLLHIPHNWTLNSSVHSPQTKEPVEARDPLNVSNPFSSFLWILLTSFYSFLGMCVYQPQPRAHSSVDKWARRKWEKWSPNSSCQCANWLFTDCGPGNSAGFRMVAAW